jgi:hypothetical protein
MRRFFLAYESSAIKECMHLNGEFVGDCDIGRPMP